MKLLVAALALLFLALQYRLWFGTGSVQEAWRAQEAARATNADVVRLSGRNQALAAEVRDLKSGMEAVEERARSDLGMIDVDETFFQFVRERRGEAAPAPDGVRTDAGDAGADSGAPPGVEED